MHAFSVMSKCMVEHIRQLPNYAKTIYLNVVLQQLELG